MKFKLVINKDAEEEITAVVHERTEMIDAIRKNNLIDIPATYKKITSVCSVK